MKSLKIKTAQKSLISLFLGFFSWLIAKKAEALNFAESSGLSKTANNAGFPAGSEFNPEESIIQTISLVLTFIGVLFLILMIYGGFMWMTARGAESQVDKAKKVIVSSIVGLIIVFGAYAISYFVVNFFSQGVVK